MTYEVTLRELPEQPIVSIRRQVAADELKHFFGATLGEVFSHLKLLGVPATGHPFVIYHQFGPAGIDAEACVPVGRTVSATGSISTRVISAMTVAQTLHVGPYEELAGAYGALTEWARHKHFEPAGPMQERYLNGPGEVTSPSEYRTEIEMPVVPLRVAVPA
jgi:effector-binding domain-containing protein